MTMGPVILVVQGVGRNRVTQMLERHGYTVIRAVNGKQAVGQVKDAPPDLAVLDPSSLRINPSRLSHMIRRAAESVPIMWILDEGTTVSQDGVADLWLERPFTSRKLLNRVRKLLPEPDSGTVWEVGYAMGLGKTVVGYSSNMQTLKEKTQTILGLGNAQRDREGLLIEDFGLTHNLMYAHCVVGETFEEALKHLKP